MACDPVTLADLRALADRWGAARVAEVIGRDPTTVLHWLAGAQMGAPAARWLDALTLTAIDQATATLTVAAPVRPIGRPRRVEVVQAAPPDTAAHATFGPHADAARPVWPLAYPDHPSAPQDP